MMKTGSALISEMVGPAGSIKDGAFSRAIVCVCEEEVWPDWDGLAGLLPGDWAHAMADGRTARRQFAAKVRVTEDGSALDVMKNPALF
jgi:hypothetical protein